MSKKLQGKPEVRGDTVVWKCSQCDREFKNEAGLRRHWSNTHDQEGQGGQGDQGHEHILRDLRSDVYHEAVAIGQGYECVCKECDELV